MFSFVISIITFLADKAALHRDGLRRGARDDVSTRDIPGVQGTEEAGTGRSHPSGVRGPSNVRHPGVLLRKVYTNPSGDLCVRNTAKSFGGTVL